MATFLHRIFGALTLDAGTFEEVEADRTALSQALLVVVLSSLAAGVGAGGLYGIKASTLALASAIALTTWAAWAMLTLQIGKLLLPTPRTSVDLGELLRTIGFAAAPGLFQVFAIVAPIARPVVALTALWMLAAMIVAVRQALDYTSTLRAVAVCVIGWTLSVAIAIVLGLVFSPAVS